MFYFLNFSISQNSNIINKMITNHIKWDDASYDDKSKKLKISHNQYLYI